ncbi:laccase, multicopper oxidase, benzenediol:oxygen oxidorectuctase [Paramarasmius palmivorus]|uniref:Laccase, multicopper oxidase, benzenediol:oxygen oxidorectuctase n=1 Tax=Paramarasmius palmivorus TaxID=297713 RepID=A0AAW0CHR1_9AGAR
MLRKAFVSSALLLVQRCLAAIGPVADLVISNQDVSPDGFTRGAVVAGGTTIGPLIVGSKGDTFKLNVINQLNDNTMLQSTSISKSLMKLSSIGTASSRKTVHGQMVLRLLPNAQSRKGIVSFINSMFQIKPERFGTILTSYCDGLRGAIVVYDPLDPYRLLYDIDNESTVITLADWYHAKAKTLLFPTPDTTLINGLGRWSQGTNTPLTVISVVWGKRYRIRVANIACDPAYTFWIDDHNMNIIEVDAVNVVPKVADSFKIYAGQRYSFVLNAIRPVGNYWIRADPNLGVSGFANGINSAILRYVGAPNAEPAASTFTPSNLLQESQVIPLSLVGAPGIPGVGNADVNINLNFAFNGNLKFTVNGVEFVNPTMPVLLQIMSGAQPANNLLPTGSVYSLPANKVVEISMPGGLLGIEHTFDVVRVAGSSTYNYINPVTTIDTQTSANSHSSFQIRRDVVNIGGPNDNVTIRFRTDNPGPWFLHCHIDWHLEAGFAVVFAERTSEWTTSINPPVAWDNLCPKYDSMSPGDL